MPSSLTYPGVYVEELPSGVRTITGVATSVTAFIGRAPRGPVDEAVDITSFADFERMFGGLALDSTMSFAVRDFFQNGGARAVIVRVFHSLSGAAVDAIATAAAAATDGKAAKAASTAALANIAKAGSKAEIDAATAADATIQKLADNDNQAVVNGTVQAVRDARPDAARAIDLIATPPAPVAPPAGSPPAAGPPPASPPAAGPPAAPPATPAVPAPAPATALRFRARSPGRWAGYLRVQVAPVSGPGVAEMAKSLGVQPTDLFNLTVADLGPGGTSETHLGVSLIKTVARRVDRVLAKESDLIAWAGDDLDKATVTTPDFTTIKGDALANAYATLDAAVHADSAHTAQTASNVVAAKQAVQAAQKAALDGIDDGGPLTILDFLPLGGEAAKKGLYALDQLYTRDGIFNLLCIPPYVNGDVEPALIAAAGAYCEKRRAMLIVDAPTAWMTVQGATKGFSNDPDEVGYRGRNGALFFPRLLMPNPLNDNQIEPFAACGAVAGIFARTDTQRGVWKSPAGLDASFSGVSAFTLPLTDDENGLLNPLGINCLRTFPVFGRVLWGARTLRGADAFADEYKYTAVRRTALYIEESLYRALKWVVFEPNDEPLWAQIRLNVGAFMHNLFRQQAFQGQTKSDAYFVRCDATTTTQNDINLGVVNINVGFAPLKPAEFVVIRLQQMTGLIET